MISVIVPTYNEALNVPTLIAELEKAFKNASMTDYEIVVMDDDSPDGTWRLVEEMKNPKARSVNRRGKPRGLSAAVIDGFGQAHGDILAVIDADLSHPPALVPKLVQAVLDGAEVAVGSRYVKGGGVTDWPWIRRVVSRGSCLLALPVTRVKDATSGFFAMRKRVAESVSLNPWGFKIGLEIFVKGRHQNKIQEIPYVFTDRRAGQSKLSSKVMRLYLRQLLDLLFRKRTR